MAKVRQDEPLVPSVLDRLVDHEPEVTRETAKSRSQLLREIIQSVRRDLQDLLNTRRRCQKTPSDLEELGSSLVDYGIPDITGANMVSTESREELRRELERVIRRYEPRFKTVQVQFLDNVEPLDRTLRFRVEAMLLVQPAPEPVVFDSQLEPTSGNIEVKSQRK